MRKLFTTHEKLCFLSLLLSFSFKPTWHACEQTVPSRQTPLRRKLALRLQSGEEETSLQSCSRGRAVSAIGTLARRPESLLKFSQTCRSSRDQAGTLPSGLALVRHQYRPNKKIRSKLKSLFQTNDLLNRRLFAHLWYHEFMESRMVWNWFFFLLYFCLSFNSGAANSSLEHR